jgi:hypothetical protein
LKFWIQVELSLKNLISSFRFDSFETNILVYLFAVSFSDITLNFKASISRSLENARTKTCHRSSTKTNSQMKTKEKGRRKRKKEKM